MSLIDRVEAENEFMDNMRPMINSLLHFVNKISEIDQKISLIGRVEAENKLTGNMRSMLDSLLHSVNNVSEINKKYHKLIIMNQILNLQIT